jgi:hypothetical protein
MVQESGVGAKHGLSGNLIPEDCIPRTQEVQFRELYISNPVSYE